MYNNQSSCDNLDGVDEILHHYTEWEKIREKKHSMSSSDYEKIMKEIGDKTAWIVARIRH